MTTDRYDEIMKRTRELVRLGDPDAIIEYAAELRSQGVEEYIVEIVSMATEAAMIAAFTPDPDA